jgi:5-(aminomethyl)-3-furanmethanol phosphate kinase
MPLILYKLGGSLLTLPDLDSRLMALFRQPLPASLAATAGRPFTRALLVGGGRATDVVRQWDRRHRLGDQRSHDLAVAAMGLNARLVKLLLPASEWATKRNSIGRPRAGGRVAVLDPQAVLDEAERRATDRLPRSWDVTSDSVAAFLAIEWGAAALVLVKSTPRPGGKSILEASRRGSVDKHFPQLASRIPLLAWVNLRARQPSVERWF